MTECTPKPNICLFLLKTAAFFSLQLEILTTKWSEAPQSVNKSKRHGIMRYNDEEHNTAFPYCAAINPLPAASYGVV